MRLLSLAPSITEILFALGVGEQLVGVTALCDYPAAARTLPKVSGWTTGHNFSYLERYQPDLVFTCMYLPPGLAAACAAQHIPLVHGDPHTIAAVLDSMITIGQAVEKITAARNVITQLSTQLAQLQVTQSRYRPRVYCEEWHTPPMVSGNWVPELVALAGGVSLEQPGVMSGAITTEQIQAFDPEMIVAHWCGFGPRSRLAAIAARPGWENLTAVREHRLITIDDGLLNRPGPRLWLGAMALHTALKFTQ